MEKLSKLNAISPVDGRYRRKTEALSEHMSEFALIKNRLKVETSYIEFLSKNGIIRPLSNSELITLGGIWQVDGQMAQTVKDIETKGLPADMTNGLGEIKRTNHDVKAVEYFIKIGLMNTSMRDLVEKVHFALTSEDVTNLAYALMICDTVNRVMLPAMGKLQETVESLAWDHADTPMLARTHGQPASPTTFGKEFLIFSERMRRQIGQLGAFRLLAKLNGATGNYNAHVAACPTVDWMQFTSGFISHLNTWCYAKNRGYWKSPMGISPNLVTPQIEPHDTYAELFSIFMRFNTILIDFSQDMWRYISDSWIVQKPVEGEVGSSTMPHKVNPIDFENCEGNLGIANALFAHFSSKLPISRLQRDLSDSTVERNFGVAFAHSLIAYDSALRGLGKISVNEGLVRSELESHPEVLAEAIQTILREGGYEMPYEKLKELTRGRGVTIGILHEFISSLDVDDGTREHLLALTPSNYTGLAGQIVKSRCEA